MALICCIREEEKKSQERERIIMFIENARRGRFNERARHRNLGVSEWEPLLPLSYLSLSDARGALSVLLRGALSAAGME